MAALRYRPRWAFVVLVCLFVSHTYGACFEDTSPWTRRLSARRGLFAQDMLADLSNKVALIGEELDFENVSFSASATTLQETFWSYHHTAHQLNESRPGANPVTGDSFYRVASITKMFTTTAILQLHAAGSLNLDESVLKYLPKLHGSMPWKDVTLRMLVSQSSGLGRDWSQGDLTKGIPNMLEKGFPPPEKRHLADCYEHNDFFTSCNETDLYKSIPYQRPVFAPNRVGSYSNQAFEILGLVVAAVTNVSYEDYVTEHILKSWNIVSGATFETPDDDVAVLPKNNSWFFTTPLGIHSPAGGLYATTNGLDGYLRNMMLKVETQELGAPSINIFMPASYSFGLSSGYGLTWEIFRSSKMLDSGMPVTFFTKGGGHPGYITIIIAVPDYGIGMTVLCAGDKAGKALDRVREIVTTAIIRAADEAANRELERVYTGRFTWVRNWHDTGPELTSGLFDINSSLTLAHDPSKGLYIREWVSNSSDMLTTLDEILTPDNRGIVTYRLVATGLELQGAHGLMGEVWRGVPLLKEKGPSLWADFCVNDVDGLHYDGKPFLEFVFFQDGEVIEIPSFRVRLRREHVEDDVTGDRSMNAEQRILVQTQI